MKKNNVNFITDSKFGIFYSKFYIDRYTGEIHILKSINVVDSFDVQIDTALFNDLNSNYFGTINPCNYFDEIIEVLTISAENQFYVFTSTNGCQMIDLLPDFINQYFIGQSKFELIQTLYKNLLCNCTCSPDNLPRKKLIFRN